MRLASADHTLASGRREPHTKQVRPLGRESSAKSRGEVTRHVGQYTYKASCVFIAAPCTRHKYPLSRSRTGNAGAITRLHHLKQNLRTRERSGKTSAKERSLAGFWWPTRLLFSAIKDDPFGERLWITESGVRGRGNDFPAEWFRPELDWEKNSPCPVRQWIGATTFRFPLFVSGVLDG
jgi:hypothetical protein